MTNLSNSERLSQSLKCPEHFPIYNLSEHPVGLSHEIERNNSVSRTPGTTKPNIEQSTPTWWTRQVGSGAPSTRSIDDSKILLLRLSDGLSVLLTSCLAENENQINRLLLKHKFERQKCEIKHSNDECSIVTSNVKPRSTNIIQFHWGKKDWRSKCSYDWQSNTIKRSFIQEQYSLISDTVPQCRHGWSFRLKLFFERRRRRTRVQTLLKKIMYALWASLAQCLLSCF